MKKILVLDDDEFILTMIIAALDPAFYQVVTCLTVAEAERHMAETAFDAVISDVSLPDKDGLAFVKDIRAAGNQVPILMISGEDFSKSGKSHTLNTICLYANEVLGKPITKGKLLSTLNEMMDNAPVNTKIK